MKIFIGWDSREEIAYEVCKHSILARSSENLEIIPLKQNNLRELKLYWRSVDDLASTEFSLTRFLVPQICNFKGIAVFVDCDFLFLDDISKLVNNINPSYAVNVVQHSYLPKESLKMDNKVQHIYPRKNWSSLMVFNCAHPGNRNITKEIVNSSPPSFLHRFGWLNDYEIGSISHSWNYLEGWYKEPEDGKPQAVHFTRGGPWFEQWKDVDYNDLWLQEKERYLAVQHQ